MLKFHFIDTSVEYVTYYATFEVVDGEFFRKTESSVWEGDQTVYKNSGEIVSKEEFIKTLLGKTDYTLTNVE